MSVLCQFVIVVALAACVPAAGEAQPSVAGSISAELTQEELLAMPVGWMWEAHLPFIGDESAQRVLFDTFERRLVQCMADAGFDVEPRDYVPLPREPHPLDRDAAERLGYQPDPGIPLRADPNMANPAYVRVLEGTPEEPGCAARTDDLVYGSVAFYTDDIAFALNDFATYISTFFSSAEADALVSAWSRCMDDKGSQFVERIEELDVDDTPNTVGTGSGPKR